MKTRGGVREWRIGEVGRSMHGKLERIYCFKSQNKVNQQVIKAGAQSRGSCRQTYVNRHTMKLCRDCDPGDHHVVPHNSITQGSCVKGLCSLAVVLTPDHTENNTASGSGSTSAAPPTSSCAIWIYLPVSCKEQITISTKYLLEKCSPSSEWHIGCVVSVSK